MRWRKISAVSWGETASVMGRANAQNMTLSLQRALMERVLRGRKGQIVQSSIRVEGPCHGMFVTAERMLCRNRTRLEKRDGTIE